MKFPVDAVLPRCAEVLAQNRILVLEAPPGSGKTTCLAPFLLENSPAWLGKKKIVLLEPRRLAARMAAEHMSRQRGCEVGGEVGYRIRLENKTSSATRIEILTEGLLVQRILHDPELADTALLVFDEFHERSLFADTALAFALDLRSALRTDLRIAIMSATLDTSVLTKVLPESEVVSAQGKMFPVETKFLPSFASKDRWCNPALVAKAVLRAIAEEEGSVLVFLPGEGEIRRVHELLRDASLPPAVSVHPLYGALGKSEQRRAVEPPLPGERKVVLATSIAESSLTIEGIRVVIDAGWMRVPRFSPSTGMSRLETLRVSRDRADQRRGRAGRLCPGVCLRLWDEATDKALTPTNSPEIFDADLAPLVLQCAEWGVSERTALPWIDPPPDASWRRARELLTMLGAIDGHGITGRGRKMAKLPVHPRLSHMITLATEKGCAQRACLLAALVAEAPSESSFRRETDFRRLADRPSPKVRELASRWSARFSPDRTVLPDGILLAWAFPDQLAKRRSAQGKFLLRNGRGVVLEETDVLSKEPWLVCLELQDAPGDAKIRLAAPIAEEDAIAEFGHLAERKKTIKWDRQKDCIVATEDLSVGAITLKSSPLKTEVFSELFPALAEGIRSKGIENLPWSKTALELRARVNFLRKVLPQENWPDFSGNALEKTLEEWLAPFCNGVNRWAKLENVAWTDALFAALSASGHDRRQLDILAPERLEVPTGSRIAVHYEDGTPRLSVRIQEVFGMKETPKVAGGRIPIVMQLLSPAQRPVQITTDLRSFWQEGYAIVRKDLRGRYPKHYWPEDPSQAQPTRRLRPEGKQT